MSTSLPTALRRLRAHVLAPAVAVLTVVALAGCGSNSNPLSDKSGGSGGSGGSTSVVIGSADFPESELLMQIYAQALEAKGVKVTTKPNIGSREVYMKAFQNGELDILPEYDGPLLDYLAGGKEPTGLATPADVDKELTKVLPDGSQLGTTSAAADGDTITVSKDLADKDSLTSIADLAPVADKLTFGGSPEWPTRYQARLKSLYGVSFKEVKKLDAGGPLTVKALQGGDVDAADVFSTDASIAANNWVSLQDPKGLYLAANVVPLIRSSKATDTVTSTLDAVSKALTTDNLAKADAEVQNDKKSPEDVAKEFLADNNLS